MFQPTAASGCPGGCESKTGYWLASLRRPDPVAGSWVSLFFQRPSSPVWFSYDFDNSLCHNLLYV